LRRRYSDVTKKSGLGKGLGALGLKKDAKKEIKQPAAPAPVELNEGEVVRELALKDIRPNEKQPRKTFDEDSLDELKDSIRQYGVLQPILVKKSDKGYELIAGERRYRAAKLAGLKTIPAIERKFTRQELTEVALSESAA
jgi:ParB family chromosome partitioning protein